MEDIDTNGMVNRGELKTQSTFTRELARHKMRFDPDDVIILTDKDVPDFVTFTVSLGKNFNINPAAERRRIR